VDLSFWYQNVSMLDFVSMMEMVSGDNWSHKTATAVKMSPLTDGDKHQLFTGRMPFLSPNQSTEGMQSHLIC